jgi:hypothetical protein
MFWKIKDPFIKEFNYGCYLKIQDELPSVARKRLKDTITVMESMIELISKGELKEIFNDQ